MIPDEEQRKLFRSINLDSGTLRSLVEVAVNPGKLGDFIEVIREHKIIEKAVGCCVGCFGGGV